MTTKELKEKVIAAKDEIVEALYEADKMAWEDGMLTYTVYLAEKNGDLSVVTISSRPTKEEIESYARNYGTPVCTIKEFCYRNMDRVRDYFLNNHMHYNELMDYLYKLMDDETREVIMDHIEAEDLDLAESIEYIERDFPTLWEDCIASIWYEMAGEAQTCAEDSYNDFINRL